MSENKKNKTNEEILQIIADNFPSKAVEFRSKLFLDSLEDNNAFNDLEEVLSWFNNKVDNCPMKVDKIPLNETKGWHADSTGNIVNDKGAFFEVTGVRISNVGFRESGIGWDQPMITQDWKSSVSGIICKKFNDVYHFLLQAKAEPGNYPIIQLSPTLQATYSNLYKAHGGRRPTYAEYFDDPNPENIIYRQWLPEDGGRFLKKMVLDIVIEIDESEEIDVKDDFMWVTIYQIKELLKKDYIVNPHVRSIIAGL